MNTEMRMVTLGRGVSRTKSAWTSFWGDEFDEMLKGYRPRFGERRVRAFENCFVIVPAVDLKRLVAGKSSGKKGVYSFYLSFDGDRVTETRDGSADYSEYLDRWDLISKALQ